MTTEIGPIQLIVYGFEHPKFGGGIASELRRLQQQNLVRVLDALVVHKTADGDIRLIEVTDLTPALEGKQGSVVGGLVGLVKDDGVDERTKMPAEAAGATDGSAGAREAWDVLDDIPNDTAAALVLLEHRWAIPLRGAIHAEGGAAIGDLWIHPTDLMAAGLITAEPASV